MLDVSIIIVNWNGKDLLTRCIQAVQSTVKQVAYETIVIDNASSDGSQAMVRQAFPDVILIENAENAGFASANNQGMAIAQGRYLLLLNSDAFVEDNTVDGMAAFMDAHPEAGMSGCKLLYEDRRLQPSAYQFPTLKTELYIALQLNALFPRSREFGQFAMTWWDFNDVREVEAIMGAFMLVRREAYTEVGGMDTGFFMYSEEIDWCIRFQRAGWKTLYNPAVQAVHLWGGSSKRIREEMFIQLHRSKVQFFRKHYGAFSAGVLKGIIGFSCLLRIIPGAVLYRVLRRSSGGEKLMLYRRLLAHLGSL
jgi:GT2 family glycosyltransferase